MGIVYSFFGSFVLENLAGENAFVLSLSTKACLESNGTCLFERNIFNRVKFSKRFCDYSTMLAFPIKGTQINKIFFVFTTCTAGVNCCMA